MNQNNRISAFGATAAPPHASLDALQARFALRVTAGLT